MTTETTAVHHLDGLRVVDLTRILSGPFCSMMLADMGADVIKIEPPGGDPIRGQGVMVEGFSGYFASFNRNKRSVLLDLRSDAGQAALRRLIATADIVVDNFRPGVMDSMGLDWATLQSIRPGLIHTSVTGFGDSGPYVDRPAFDFIAQAMSGFMSLNGTPQTGPMRTGVPISDLVAGLYAAMGTLAAVIGRHRSGQGERVGASLVDGLVSMGAFASANFLNAGRPPASTGNDHPLVSPYGLFSAADGPLAIAPSHDGVYRKLLKALELEHLRDHPDFRDNAARVRNRAAINTLIQAEIGKHGKAHWIRVLNAAGVPCGELLDLAQAFADPQILSQEMVIRVEQPGRGAVRMTGFPVKFKQQPCSIRHPAPELGAHTVQALREAGYTEQDAQALLGMAQAA